jgi:hypothetical protein
VALTLVGSRVTLPAAMAAGTCSWLISFLRLIFQ